MIRNLTAAIETIRAKRPSAKRIDLMTIIRSPQNGWCHTTTPPLRPPLGPGTDHDATLQDSHVPDYVDAAFAKVAAAYPDLVSVAPKFEAHALSREPSYEREVDFASLRRWLRLQRQPAFIGAKA